MSRYYDPEGNEITEKEWPAYFSDNRLERMAIRRYVFQVGPSTAFQIADALAPVLGRQHDSIRSAVSRAGLTMWPGGTAPSGRACSLYGTTGITVPTHGRV